VDNNRVIVPQIKAKEDPPPLESYRPTPIFWDNPAALDLKNVRYPINVSFS
jgi:hypothetical protein